MRLSQPYLAENTEYVDIEADVTEQDLHDERKRSPNAGEEAIEYTAIYRKICTQILNYNAFLLHSSAVVLDGQAYAFTAPSGTGKSTHTSLWLRHFGHDRAFIINDDKPIVRFINGEYIIYGTPWSGKTNTNKNASAPLKAVCFVHRAESNLIKRTSAQAALTPLLNQVYRPYEEGYSMKLFDELDRFLNTVDFYDLYCNISTNAAQIAYEGMKG